MSDELEDAGPSEAKQVLLRALDNITRIEEETGGKVGYLVVCHATTYHEDGEEHSRTVRGWDATDHPHFVLTGMLEEIKMRLLAEGGAFDPIHEDDTEDED